MKANTVREYIDKVILANDRPYYVTNLGTSDEDVNDDATVANLPGIDGSF